MSSVVTRPPETGTPVRGRVDGRPKVSGQALYTNDLKIPNLLYGAVVRSPYPSARILAVHKEEAEKLPGVHVVLAGEDIPYGEFGRIICDTPVLAKEVVRYVGEKVAAVVADSPELAQEAAALIEVEYEPLPAVLDAAEALSEEAPRVHQEPWKYVNAVVKEGAHPNLQSHAVWQNGGDVEEALARSHRVFERSFRTQARHHGYLEPHVCIASYSDQRIEFWVPNKGPYLLRVQLGRWMGVDPGMFHVHTGPIGGDFGGKGSLMDIPLAICLSKAVGRPVKLRMNYAEELMAANPRHTGIVTVRLGVGESGNITALDYRGIMDSGAYGGFKPVGTLQLIGVPEAGAPYRIPAIRIESNVVYTNTVPRGHFRGPGAVQGHFPAESIIDMAAREMGIDPVEFRRKNLLNDGELTALGEELLESRGHMTLDAALEELAALPPQELPEGDWATGVGYSIYSRQSHGGKNSAAVQPQEDGSVKVLVPFPDQGAGQLTMARNVASRALGLPHERVQVQQVQLAEMELFSFDSGVSGSWVTLTGGEALRKACERLLQELKEGGLPAGYNTEQLRTALAHYAKQNEGRIIVEEQDYMQGMPHATTHVVQVARVGVDKATGQVVVSDLITAIEVADIINPASHQVQIEGAAVFGFSDAVLEDLEIEEGKVTTANLGDYKIPSASDLPNMRFRVIEGGKGIGELNVKGIGEHTNVGVAAAVANAVADAVGVRITHLPITAEKVYFALHPEEVKS